MVAMAIFMLEVERLSHLHIRFVDPAESIVHAEGACEGSIDNSNYDNRLLALHLGICAVGMPSISRVQH